MFPERIILLAPNLAGTRPAATPGTPTRPTHCMSGFWIRQVPGHALHENVLRRQKGVVQLVGPQEQSAFRLADKPVING